LDGALGSLNWYEMGRLVALSVVGGLEIYDLGVPSTPNFSVILCFCDSDSMIWPCICHANTLTLIK